MQSAFTEEIKDSKKEVVVFTETKESLDLSQDIKELIEAGWAARKKWRPELTVSMLLRVTGVQESPEGGQIQVQPDITYKDVVGLRYHREDLSTPYMGSAFQALTLMLHVVTADGVTISLERDSGDWEHSLEFPGMFIRANGSNMTDVKHYISELLGKDLNVDMSEVHDMAFLSFLDFKEICEFMVIYHVALTLTLAELTKRAAKAVHALPEMYDIRNHKNFFTLPLHYPTSEAISHVRETKAGSFVL